MRSTTTTPAALSAPPPSRGQERHLACTPTSSMSSPERAPDAYGQLETERPTLPAPASLASTIRLRVCRITLAGATVDLVTCDLTRDPRSEDFQQVPAPDSTERPPAHSIVRALKGA